MEGKVSPAGEPSKTIVIEGSIDLNIADCVDSFKPICTPTEEAVQFQNLFNALLHFGDFWKKENEPVQLNYPQDEDPQSESGFAYNTIFNRDMVDYLDNLVDEDHPNRNWYYFFDDYYGNVMKSYVSDIEDGVSFGEIGISLTMSGTGYSFDDIIAFGNIKPYDGDDYDFVITARVDDGTNKDYIDLYGNIDYVPMGTCELALPSDFDPSNANSSLAYTQ